MSNEKKLRHNIDVFCDFVITQDEQNVTFKAKTW